MITTPLCDFIDRYEKANPTRLHMPGHKGTGPLGVESRDITEITGADSLYEATGILRESEQNAGALFSAHTFYSTEGSSLCVRAMIRLLQQYAVSTNRAPLLLAGRNAHKSFVGAAALMGIDVAWLFPEQHESYLSCSVTPERLEDYFSQASPLPLAVYITSPDYLGNTADIAALAAVCHAYGVLLAVDNAHGAYLKFLPQSQHPMDLGADICCDSAHKTLPVLTGGAYLHVAHTAPPMLASHAKTALSLFGTTSPSYVILQSLDAANPLLAGNYRETLCDFIKQTAELKQTLKQHGYTLCGNEPLKLTLMPKSYGYSGTELAAYLENKGLICEFADPDFVVCMVTPATGTTGLLRLKEQLLALPPKSPITQAPPQFAAPQPVLPLQKALFAATETIPAAESVGRILADITVGCPPAVPLIVCGERITPAIAASFEYYGIQTCTVVAE